MHMPELVSLVLIAISGLAKGFQQYIGASPADYLAGIWAQTLPYGLLWGCTIAWSTSSGTDTTAEPISGPISGSDLVMGLSQLAIDHE